MTRVLSVFKMARDGLSGTIDTDATCNISSKRHFTRLAQFSATAFTRRYCDVHPRE
ncbi:hypothetical protein [Falsiruegeria litorea]|uniref:hypothetical protein n=1 Tax=Falsiruegeria litorea TaxID=1280831 RepID=UPI0013FDF30F|nr:hypothetical protein [Falsiruegeria litorea]